MVTQHENQAESAISHCPCNSQPAMKEPKKVIAKLVKYFKEKQWGHIQDAARVCLPEYFSLLYGSRYMHPCACTNILGSIMGSRHILRVHSGSWRTFESRLNDHDGPERHRLLGRSSVSEHTPFSFEIVKERAADKKILCRCVFPCIPGE